MASPTEFTVGAQPVRITSSTRYEGGSITTVQPGVRVEMKGSLSNGALVAQKISFEDGSDD